MMSINYYIAMILMLPPSEPISNLVKNNDYYDVLKSSFLKYLRINLCSDKQAIKVSRRITLVNFMGCYGFV